MTEVEVVKDKKVIGSYLPSEYETAFADAIISHFNKELGQASLNSDDELIRRSPLIRTKKRAISLNYYRFSPFSNFASEKTLSAYITNYPEERFHEIQIAYPNLLTSRNTEGLPSSEEDWQHIEDGIQEHNRWKLQVLKESAQREGVLSEDDLKIKLLSITKPDFLLPKTPITQWPEYFEVGLVNLEDLAKDKRSLVLDREGRFSASKSRHFAEVYFSIDRDFRFYNPPWEKIKEDPIPKCINVKFPRLANQ